MAYSQEERSAAIAAVVAGLSKGTPLTVICSADGMPSDDTIRSWASEDDTISRAIARAREAGWDQIALDALAIADATENDTVLTEAGERPNTEWITRSKLRVETRLKLLAKWDPKRYGDATTVKHADADGNKMPIDDTTRVTRLAALALALQIKAGDAAD
ncbi:MAG: hypothetical protein INR68_16765 [Methylobacterium mesophilicum]|nr:hypothetical protein [Methylobacterium mesophilicum]